MKFGSPLHFTKVLLPVWGRSELDVIEIADPHLQFISSHP